MLGCTFGGRPGVRFSFETLQSARESSDLHFSFRFSLRVQARLVVADRASQSHMKRMQKCVCVPVLLLVLGNAGFELIVVGGESDA